jgi:hypothetical protein
LYRLGLLENGPSYWNDYDSIKKVEVALNKLNKTKNTSINLSKAVDFNLNNFISVFERDFVTELR